MNDFVVKVKKSDMKAMERKANAILKAKGINPDEYWYDIHVKMVLDNLDTLEAQAKKAIADSKKNKKETEIESTSDNISENKNLNKEEIHYDSNRNNA